MRKFKSNNREIMNALSLFTQIGITMFITVGMCLLFGSWLDRLFSTSPLFLLIFIILGILAAFRNLFKMTMRFWNIKDDIRNGVKKPIDKDGDNSNEN